MAINKVQKVPRGLEVQSIAYQEISDGQRPAIGASAAPYLPVVKEDKYHEYWITITAGTIVAFDQTTLGASIDNSLWLVPANGGAAATVTYTADDVNLTLDIDQLAADTEALVSTAAAATTNIAANIPAGFAPYDYFAKQMEKVYFNFKPQPNVAFVCDYLIEVPLVYDTGAATVTQDTISSGDLLVAGANGEPISFTMPTTYSAAAAQASVEQIVGRCVHVRNIATEDALDKVQTVPGLALPGTGTQGRKLHEYVNLVGTSTLVSRVARINVTLL